jgi:hypothetical protein
MKKIVLIIACLFTFILTSKAQEISDNAIGLRLSGGEDFGAEISYQKALLENNRLEIGLGLGENFGRFKAVGLYQWVWNLEENFNWYAGFGGGLSTTNKTSIFGAGNVGVEYNFDVPILLSLDFRPEIRIVGDAGLRSVVALSVRYQF